MSTKNNNNNKKKKKKKQRVPAFQFFPAISDDPSMLPYKSLFILKF